MKKKVYILMAGLMAVSSLGLTSCSDFLDEDNKTGQTADLLYNTKTGIDGLVASSYSFLRGWYGKEASLALTEGGTDMFYYGGDSGEKLPLTYQISPEVPGNIKKDNLCLDEYWEMFFAAVDVCNTALKYLPTNANLTDAQKAAYMGEEYFLRAFYYWHLVNTWGAVPYNKEPVKTASTAAYRNSEEEVYSYMLEDLDDAIASFSIKDNEKSTGRASLTAARALKARVLLYAACLLGENGIITNDDYEGKNLYQLAQAEAEAVIGSGYASLNPSFFEEFRLNNESVTTNQECIFGVVYANGHVADGYNALPKRYSTGADYSSNIVRVGSPKGGNASHLMFVGKWSNSGADLTDVFVRATKPDQALQGIPVAEYYSRYSRGFARFIPTVHMFNEFKKIEKTDQRYGATIRDVYTIAPGLVSAKYPLMKDTAIYFTNFTATSAEGQAAIAKSYNKYRLYTLTGGDLPLYTSADESVAVPYSNPSGTPVSALYGDNRYNTKDHMGEWTFLALQKFEDNDFDFSSNAKITPEISERDYFCIRISEMYLIKAECQLHTGGDALATLNQLRSVRAIPGKNNSISGPVTIDTILRERMFELTGEYQRWFDLRRTGKLIEYVKAYNGQANGKNASSFGPGIQDYHMLRPIPQAQMDAVTNVTVYPDVSGFYQNPGY